MSLEILARDGAARRGRLTTAHGTVETPAFMPVGTLGAVKGLSPQALEETGASVMLANLYHLSVRPGIDVIEGVGGVHTFSGWPSPILTDSGGYQVFSLAHRRSIDEGGVKFRSHVDGSPVRFTPESVAEMQGRLGVDIAMVLDECPPWPAERHQVSKAWDRTLRWANRSLETWNAAPRTGGLFGIVQGGVFRDLRERAAEELCRLPFAGFAIGGVSVGEPKEELRNVVEWTTPRLPEDRPRYLMGVGYPEDILHAVSRGIDLFDCVLPARNARHGLLFTRQGPVKIKNTRYRTDPRPVEEGCPCPLCSRMSRSFLHHLFRCKEITGPVLATQHNLRHYLDFMKELRQAIASGALSKWAESGVRIQSSALQASTAL